MVMIVIIRRVFYHMTVCTRVQLAIL